MDPSNPAAIAAGVSALADRLPDIKALCIDASKIFAWNKIAERYYRIYSECQKSGKDCLFAMKNRH